MDSLITRPALSLWPAHWELTWREKDTGKFVRVFDVDVRETCVCFFDIHNPSDTASYDYDRFLEDFRPVK